MWRPPAGQYHGSRSGEEYNAATPLTRELPKALHACEFRFQMDKKGNIVRTNGVGKPEVKCQ
ncbi:MAG: hypothetical protein M3P27_03375 [Acidobacteriota bacterium]|nr:hypothetical protein [Acidobacteriota bacterium]